MYDIQDYMDHIHDQIKIYLAHPNDIYDITSRYGGTMVLHLGNQNVTFPLCYNGLMDGIGHYEKSLMHKACIPRSGCDANSIERYISGILYTMSEIPNPRYRRAIVFLPLTTAIITAMDTLNLPFTALIMGEITETDPFYKRATTLDMGNIISNFPDLQYSRDALWTYARPYFDIMADETVSSDDPGSITKPDDVRRVSNIINRVLKIYAAVCDANPKCDIVRVDPKNYLTMKSDITPVIRKYVAVVGNAPMRQRKTRDMSQLIATQMAKYIRSSISNIAKHDFRRIEDYYSMWFDTTGHICLRSEVTISAEDTADCLCVSQFEDFSRSERCDANHAGYITLPYKTMETIYIYAAKAIHKDEGKDNEVPMAIINAIEDLRKELNCEFTVYQGWPDCIDDDDDD